MNEKWNKKFDGLASLIPDSEIGYKKDEKGNFIIDENGEKQKIDDTDGIMSEKGQLVKYDKNGNFSYVSIDTKKGKETGVLKKEDYFKK